MNDEDAILLVAGQPYPDPEMAHAPGSHWAPEYGMLFMGQPGLTEAEIDSWGPLTRVHFIAHEHVIVAVLQYLKPGVAVEIPGFRLPGSDLPDWVAADRPPGHLLLRQVVVDSTTGIVVNMRAFTTSPHVTKALIREARERWAEPISQEQAVADFAAFQRRYPDDKAVRAAAFASCRPGD